MGAVCLGGQFDVVHHCALSVGVEVDIFKIVQINRKEKQKFKAPSHAGLLVETIDLQSDYLSNNSLAKKSATILSTAGVSCVKLWSNPYKVSK